MTEQLSQEEKVELQQLMKPGKSEKILRITFLLLVIAIILLLGAWAAKLFIITVG